MLATISSCALLGIEALPVSVEVSVSTGLPGYHVVGLPTTSIKEGAVRIRAALEALGGGMPRRKVTVNLAPADRRKEGAAFDLPIALGILAADGAIDPRPLDGMMVLGELSLGGELRPIRGALSAAMLARDQGLRGILVPRASAAEAAEVGGLDVRSADNLQELIELLVSGGELSSDTAETTPDRRDPIASDMADVRGQHAARLALEVAVAGGHNALLLGPPGIGKTMLARRIPSILPALSREEALETTRIHSAAFVGQPGLVRTRPFRAPHHTISTAALVGGGVPPRPGEVSLAHNGVLFLDELPEFRRSALEALRQPLEDREVHISRARASVILPASFLLVAAANPCPCGWLGTRERVCTDSLGAIERYRGRLSGPLLDRIDLHMQVTNVSIEDMRGAEPGESSAVIRARVERARERQLDRLRSHGGRTNADMSPAALRATCTLTESAEGTLKKLHAARQLSGRAIDRLIRVSRTIADLDERDVIDAGDVLEAAGHRLLDVEPGRLVGSYLKQDTLAATASDPDALSQS